MPDTGGGGPKALKPVPTPRIWGKGTQVRGGKPAPSAPEGPQKRGLTHVHGGTNTRPTFVTRLIICSLHKRQMGQR